MTFEKFIRHWINESQKYPHWRDGQAFYNTLNTTRRELAVKITGTECDPYFTDDNLPSAITWVQAHWDDQPANK